MNSQTILHPDNSAPSARGSAHCCRALFAPLGGCSPGQATLAMGLLLSVLLLPGRTQGQGLEVSDSFDSYNNPGDDLVGGWAHYDPGAAGGQTNSWSFPADGSGGKAYRLIGPPSACVNNINRGGSYR